MNQKLRSHVLKVLSAQYCRQDNMHSFGLRVWVGAALQFDISHRHSQIVTVASNKWGFMSSLYRFSGNQSVPIGIAVYSRDVQIVKSISEVLSRKNQTYPEIDYVVIQQTSVSSMDNVCVASILDISMVGQNSSRVAEAVAKIKTKEPTHSIFLIGEKEDLVTLMSDDVIDEVVHGQFPLPLLATEIMPALNYVFNSSLLADNDVISKTGDIDYRYLISVIVAIIAVFYWYITSTEVVLQPTLSSPDTVEKISSKEPLLNGYVNSDENTNALPLEADTKKAKEVMESKVIPQLDPQIEVDDSEIDSFEVLLNEPEPLFDEVQEEILGKARSALKKGYIVGPDGSSAWYFYRLALEADQLGDLADERAEVVLAELKAEFDLAIKLGKFGRSKSILRVFKDINPLHQSVGDMQASFDQRFSEPSL